VLPFKRITACFKQTSIYEKSERNNQQKQGQDESLSVSRSSSHYYAPVTSLENLRKRYGSRKSVFGDWTNQETRHFYKQQLPRSLQSEFYYDTNLFPIK
jgi:hypothetical protein